MGETPRVDLSVERKVYEGEMCLSERAGLLEKLSTKQ